MPKKSVKRTARRPSTKTLTPATVLYLYGISQMRERMAPEIPVEGIDGVAAVEAVPCGSYLCWISRVSRRDFADHVPELMHNLEWLATAGFRHQHVVAEISEKLPTLPARFGTIFANENSLYKHMKQRSGALQASFRRVAGADEWGVKIFAIAAPKDEPVEDARSGSEYLKRKAERLQPRKAGKLDKEVQAFLSSLKELAVAHSVGGKASAGQPGLLWHGSFLVRRKNRRQLDTALRKYAAKWKDVRRVDCSGPWPPYSFVGNHGE